MGKRREGRTFVKVKKKTYELKEREGKGRDRIIGLEQRKREGSRVWE